MRFSFTLVLLALVSFVGACAVTPAAPAAPKEPTAPAAGAPAATASSSRSTAAPPEPLTVNVGFIPSLAYAPLYVAYEKGYFQERGLLLNLEPGAGSPTAQVGAGQLQFAGIGFDAAFLNARARGIDIRIILPIAAVNAEEGSFGPLVVRKELWDSGAVRSVADLRGRRLAQNGTSTGSTQYRLQLALATGGLNLDDVELVQGLNFPEMPQALAQGAIDGAALSEPFVTQSEERGIVVVLSDRHDLGVLANGIAANGEFVRRQPERVVDFAVAYLHAARDLYGAGRRAPENVAIVERYTRVPTATIVRTRQPYTDPNGVVPVESLLSMQRFVFANAAVELPEPLGPDELVDATFARRAVEILGEFSP